MSAIFGGVEPPHPPLSVIVSNWLTPPPPYVSDVSILLKAPLCREACVNCIMTKFTSIFACIVPSFLERPSSYIISILFVQTCALDLLLSLGKLRDIFVFFEHCSEKQSKMVV